MKQSLSVFITMLLSVFLLSSHAYAGVDYFQGFETDASGWYGYYGSTVGRVASGFNGISARSGGYYGNVVAGMSGPYTKFDGYSSVWPGGIAASIDIYLDVDWSDGYGFDYSVAISSASGSHLRDFIFHVTKDSSEHKLLIGANNNAGYGVAEDIETYNDYYTVSSTGWYTFEQSFYDAGGYLGVSMNLYSDGNLLWSEIRSNTLDFIPGVVGGNRYGWFSRMSAGAEIAIDNTQLATTPEPGTMLLMGVGAAGAAFMRRRRNRKAA